MESIGVRELRQHASVWLARVAAGESFIVTDRGEPVASLGPLYSGAWVQVKKSGAVTPAAKPLADLPRPLEPTGVTLSELLAEERADER